MLLIFFTCAIILAIYYYVNLNSDFFEKRNVKFARGIPGLGFALDPLLKSKHMMVTCQELYQKFSGTKFFGTFHFHRPMYMIRDLELIKQITVKDFDHFVNHPMRIDENIDPLFSRMLFILRDEKWRNMRSTLSPVFTGSKMRLMFKLVMEVADDHMIFLKSQMKNNLLNVELSDLLTRYANDVIAKCAFGLSVNSMKDPSNEFFQMGLKVIKFSRILQIKFILLSAFPGFCKFFNIRLLDNATSKFFNDLMANSLEYREKNNIVIHDMINILMEARKHGNIHVDDDSRFRDVGFATVEESEHVTKTGKKVTQWSNDDLVAQSMIFFLAGFETVSSAMNFIVFMLATNPQAQEKLIMEIDEFQKEIGDQLPTYENIQDMEYMDMVISECLRMWPPAIAIDRECTKPTFIENSDGSKIQLNVGDRIGIPVHAIHHDPKYFPDPEKFDPERFSKANRKSILPYSYSPFGIGPRSCIGNRFALMEAKAVVFSLLSNFFIERNEKTREPIVLKSDSFNLRAKHGFHVRFRSRK